MAQVQVPNQPQIAAGANGAPPATAAGGAAAAGANQFPSTSLYVGDLEASVTDSQLYDVFSQLGPVVSVRVCRDITTRASLGYAYVNFSSPHDATRALDMLNFTPFNGKPIRIMYSNRDPSTRRSGAANIFIKNLDKGIDNKALYDTFSAFGGILSCKVATDQSGQSKGYGFVQFEQEEAAENAISKLNGMLLNGKQVYVGPFLRKQERDNSANKSIFSNVFVKNLSENTTKEQLEEVFGQYGEISSAVVMREGDGKSKCFGFVNFVKPEDAARAVEELNGKKFDDKEWYVGKAQKKSEREVELKGKFDQSAKEVADKFQGVNLYLKNLDDTIGDDKLRELFSEFGTITSCKVMLDPNGISRGSGFVAFSSPEDRQTEWSNLAHEMTAEFRGLCAEEAFLQQELEKLQEMRTKAKMEAELWDDRISSSSAPSSHIVSKATRLWESLLARKSQHEVLASGPIEDLIAHREHRYRISGSSLLAAMDLSSPVRAGEISPPINNREQTQGNKNNDILPRTEDRSGRVHPTVDVAEILRRWTHALQRIHKQSLHLAKANDGEGPELLRCASDSGTSGHAESLAATLAEHRQHLASIQGLINQLKAAVPTMQKSIAELTEEVNTICPYPMDEYSARATSPVHAQTSGRSLENNSDEVTEMTSKLSSVQLEKASTSPALKLPHLFSLTPNSGKGLQTPKQYPASTQPSQAETLVVGKPVDPPFANDHADGAPQEGDLYVAQNIRRSVRDAALSKPSSNSGWPEDKSSDDGSEHFFIPLPAGVPRKEVDAAPNRRKQRLFSSPPQIRTARSTKEHTLNTESRLSSVSSISNQSNGVADHVNSANGLESATSMGSTGSGAQSTFLDVDESFEQVFSPPLLTDSSFFQDTYEDLLAPLSETDML